MKFLLLLSVIISPARLMWISDRPTRDKIAVENGNSPLQDKIFTVPTGKCRELSIQNRKSEQEACNDHCRDLKEFSGGDCVEEICRCKLDVKNIIRPIDEKNKDRGKKRIPGNRKVRNGVKCKNLIRIGGKADTENHRGCGVHCKLLDSENRDGYCVQGVCQCTREALEKRLKKSEEVNEEEECESDEMCLTQCRGLNREANLGVCESGTCRCSTATSRQEDHGQIPGMTHTAPPNPLRDRAVVKCEQRRKSVNEEICRSHCESFSRDHIHGRCVGGTCHCGYAVFEIMIPEKEEIIEKGIDKRPKDEEGMKPLHSRGRSSRCTSITPIHPFADFSLKYQFKSNENIEAKTLNTFSLNNLAYNLRNKVQIQI